MYCVGMIHGVFASSRTMAVDYEPATPDRTTGKAAVATGEGLVPDGGVVGSCDLTSMRRPSLVDELRVLGSFS
ncbi:MAG: hypothetical protein ABS81_16410 [Pseudonocardia sp. SCN 72-86]|nr:MAG: hypothetical protein ABS81_16410 [Pseudonocardia sp. SCN 72-86]